MPFDVSNNPKFFSLGTHGRANKTVEEQVKNYLAPIFDSINTEVTGNLTTAFNAPDLGTARAYISLAQTALLQILSDNGYTPT